MDLLGKTIGQYQLTELIHEADNVVYKGFQASMNRYVAVKILAPGQAANQTFVQQFQRDMQAISQLQHPNILPLYDYGYQDGFLYMATQYIEGGTLRERMPQYFSPERTEQMVKAIAGGLDYLQSQGIVHGNLKPSNILIDAQGQPLLADFGYTQGIDLNAQENVYLSPEQMQNTGFDGKSDVYALGILAYEMLVGEAPSPGPVPSPRIKQPNLPIGVEQAILTATAVQPEQRYQTPGQFSSALSMAIPAVAPVAAAAAVGAAAGATAAAASPKKDNKRTFILAGIAALVALLVLCLCGAIFFFGFMNDWSGSSGGEEGVVGTPPSGGGIIIIIPTAAPGVPSATANTNVNIRSGPGTDYNTIGLLKQGETAEVVGVNTERTWWAINVPAADNEVGWVANEFVTTQNTENVPILTPPPVPTPTTAPPVVITDWQGEYFDNPNLQGNPVLVRNDPAINFYWGTGSPAPEVPADNFSVRWTNSKNIPAGIYRFSTWADNGVRLFIDDKLAIDGWQEGPFRNYTVDVKLSAGTHTARMEYFHTTGNAGVSLDIGYNAEPPAPTAPKAVINGTTKAKVGQEVFFSARNSQVSPGSHLTTFNWDFGDGTTGSGVDVSHVYNNAGKYAVTLTVVDDKGLSNTDVQEITIEAGEPTPEPDEPPVAVISGPSQASVGDNVTFSAASSACSGSCVSYAWDLGDGTTANAVEIGHVYNSTGVFNVILTVTDDKGLSGTTNYQIKIDPAPVAPTDTPVPDNTPVPAPPSAVIVVDPTPAEMGENVSFNGSKSQPGNGGAIVSYEWDFGDNSEPANGAEVTHTYQTAGTFDITLTVIDESNQSNNDVTNIQITPVITN